MRLRDPDGCALSPTVDDLVVEPGEAEPAAAPEAAFTPEILEQAKRYNIDEATAKRFGSVENLKFAMADRDRVAAEWGQRQLAGLQQQQPPQQQVQQPPQQQVQQPPAAPPAAPQAPQNPQQAAQQILAGYNFDRAALKAKGYDDDTLDVLGGMAEHFNTQLATASQYIQTLAQAEMTRQQQQAQQNTGNAQAEEQAQLQGMEEFVSKLGPDWESIFGKGSGYSLAQNSPELNARIKLYQTVKGLEFADAQQNQRRPLPELLQSALNALHFTKQQEITKKALAAKAGQRRSQTLARGGSQRSQPMTGEEKAIERAMKFDKKFQRA